METGKYGRIVTLFDDYCKNGFCDTLTQVGREGRQFCVQAAIDLAEKGVPLKKAKSKYHEGMVEDGYVNDHPNCVDAEISDAFIDLNDSAWWPSNRARAAGLRNAAILELGTAYPDFGKFEGYSIEFLYKWIEPLIMKKLLADVKDLSSLVEAGTCAECIVEDCNSVKDAMNIVGNYVKLNNTKRIQLRIAAFEYALAKMNTPGYKWLKKHEGYKAPDPKTFKL